MRADTLTKATVKAVCTVDKFCFLTVRRVKNCAEGHNKCPCQWPPTSSISPKEKVAFGHMNTSCDRNVDTTCCPSQGLNFKLRECASIYYSTSTICDTLRDPDQYCPKTAKTVDDVQLQQSNFIITILHLSRSPVLDLSTNPGEPCHHLLPEWPARRRRASPRHPQPRCPSPANGKRSLRLVADQSSGRERDRRRLSLEAAAVFLPRCPRGRVRRR